MKSTRFSIPESILGTISAETFLSSYWQQQPLLIREAWPDFDPNLEPEELAGLALESNIDSRLVVERQYNGLSSTWQLREPPFTEQDFTTLPEKNWTLLVNDIDKHLPEFREILNAFDFLPTWRLDDLMISYAAPGGSVGPHVDEYDVFLIQAYGQRRWQLDYQPVDVDNYLPDTDLRIMRDFNAEDEWVLNPGDILYLPPNIAHYGIGLDRCMTYSVGFRAPTNLALLDQFIDYCYDSGVSATRFTDPNRAPARHPTEISDADTAAMRSLLASALDLPDEAFKNWLGKTLSSPKKVIEAMDLLVERVHPGDCVQLNPISTVVHTRVNDQRYWFVDGIALGAVPKPIDDLLIERQPMIVSHLDCQTLEQTTVWQRLCDYQLLTIPTMDTDDG